MKEYVSPCTDIIIADQFIFSSPELYQKNIYSLIRALCSKVKNSHVNIVIFTLKSNYNKLTSTEFEPDWDTIYSKIRKCAEKHSSFKVTFVTASKQTLEEHDRTIFTNYKYFSSGDSYNYFDSNDVRITNGRNLHAHSHAEKDNEDYFYDVRAWDRESSYEELSEEQRSDLEDCLNNPFNSVWEYDSLEEHEEYLNQVVELFRAACEDRIEFQYKVREVEDDNNFIAAVSDAKERYM